MQSKEGFAKGVWLGNEKLVFPKSSALFNIRHYTESGCLVQITTPLQSFKMKKYSYVIHTLFSTHIKSHSSTNLQYNYSVGI